MRSLFTELVQQNRADVISLFPIVIPAVHDTVPYTCELQDHRFENPHPAYYAILTNKPAILSYYLTESMKAYPPNSSLIESNRIPVQDDSTGLTLAHVAALSDDLECLRVILRLCGPQVAEMETEDSPGPLACAIIYGRIDAVRTFLEYGCCPFDPDFSANPSPFGCLSGAVGDALDGDYPEIAVLVLDWAATHAPATFQLFMERPFHRSRPVTPIEFFESHSSSPFAEIVSKYRGFKAPEEREPVCSCCQLPGKRRCHICDDWLCARHLRQHSHVEKVMPPSEEPPAQPTEGFDYERLKEALPAKH
jgi:hypothetical protein